MRSYGQYCALAKALDVVGDRWTMLIVRELLGDPLRYGELKDGLPGIATNLLADRLAHLTAAGVCRHDADGRYELTEWGRHLSRPIFELARWAAPLMTQQGAGESFKAHWLATPIGFMFGGVDPARPPLQVEIRTDDEIVTMESAGGRVTLRPGPSASPDLVLNGPPDVIVGALAGRLSEREATELGLRALGDMTRLGSLHQADWLTGPETCRVDASQPVEEDR
jgi:DNA-binding HxlR family transcriptional regulator